MPEPVFDCGYLRVTRESNGLRVTIPTTHSSQVLTQAEALQLTKALVALFKSKRGDA